MGTCVDCGRSAEGLTCSDWPNCCGYREPESAAYAARWRAVTRECDAAHATIASLREEVETLKMLLPPVGSITFPPGCDEYPDARLVADLRDRLRLLAGFVCPKCRCAPRQDGNQGDECDTWCYDCEHATYYKGQPGTVGACVSVGLRALCGRRILEGC